MRHGMTCVIAVLACIAANSGGAQMADLPTIADKTLVAWVTVADLDQAAGSVLTVEDGHDHFDAIVFGERSARRWMAGSDGFRRSQSPEEQAAYPAESAEPGTRVQVAVVYQGEQVRLYRDGALCSGYAVQEPQAFGDGAFVVLGLRHVAAGKLDCFAGTIEDARIYSVALSAEQIAALEPNQTSDPAPLAWWSFADGSVTDRMGAYPHTGLFGQDRVADGKLLLDGEGSYLVAARSEAIPRWHGLGAAGAGASAQMISNARDLRDRLLADPHRPTYHVVTPEGHCMPADPNAAIYWKGRYHLMYIVQTEKGHCWAHISSTDLVHWRHHPLALEPGNGDSGIFSGGAALDLNGVPTITYWGLGSPGGICIATSTDDLLERWTKSPHNPVIRETELGLTEFERGGAKVVYGAADPTAIWIKDGRYYLLTGNLLVLRKYGLEQGMEEHQGDTAYLLVSDDLVNWEYLHPFYQSRRDWTRADEDDMCPDFFPLPSSAEGGPLSDRHMILFISHNLGCQYYVGRYEGDRFLPDNHGRMTWVDNGYFAPESLADPAGRRIMWAWVFEQRGQQPPEWSGTMSLPRLLWLGVDGTLRMRPVPELEMLRGNLREVKGIALLDGQEHSAENVQGDCLELEVEIDPGNAKSVGLIVRRSPDGEEQTAILYDAEDRTLKIDARKSSLSDGPRNVEAAPFELRAGEPLSLRVFLDRSIVEAYANDRQAVVRRIYPERADSMGVALVATGGNATVRSLRVWDMAPANPW